MVLAFTVPADVLGRLVARVGKVVERRNTIPILSNVVVAVEANGKLTVEGTDLDIWARAETTTHTAKDVDAGSTTVPAALLSDILRKVPKGDIRFTADGRVAKLSAGRARFSLNELSVQDFPQAITIADEAKATRFVIAPDQVRRIVDDCGFAISTEETRYYLNGVFLHAPEDAAGRLVAVATDGHRLSRLRQKIDGEIDGMPGIIVPRKTVGLFNLLADCCQADEGETIAVALDDTRIVLEAPEFRIVSKLIDGTFPDYQRVIPADNLIQLETDLDPKALGAAVDRVATISAERGRAMKLDFSGDTLALSMADTSSGEGSDELALAERCGNIEIGFNASYLSGILSTFAAPLVRLTLRGPAAPAVITDPTTDDRTVVLMPMRA